MSYLSALKSLLWHARPYWVVGHLFLGLFWQLLAKLPILGNIRSVRFRLALIASYGKH